MLKKAPNLHVFKYCSRYLDDLNIPNAGNNMDKIICNDIYPRELTVLNTNPSEPSSCTYLDLDIVVENGKFTTKLYDKRKAFSFKVVTFPNLKSNIPSKQAYGNFMGELYRLCKCCSEVQEFVDNVKNLIRKLIKQNFNKIVLYAHVSKFLRARPACINKYWCFLNITMFHI